MTQSYCEKHDYRINFWFITKNQVVDRMKNADSSEKNLTTMIMKKYLFILEMSSNPTNTMIE